MADLRMTLLDLLNKSEQGADPTFLRDGIKLLAQELMDGRGDGHGRRRAASANLEPDHLPKWLPRSGLGHPSRHGRLADPQAARGHLLSEPARATPAP